MAGVDTEQLLEAVTWCHLGSGSGARPTDEGFRQAEKLGLLKHHPIWHATREGIGALVAAGRVEGKPAPEITRIHCLWARHGANDLSSAYPQFVAAWPEGIVDYWPDTYAQQRAEREQEYRDNVDEGAVIQFFVTNEEIVRPELPA
jgi:hypothetical protein